MLASFLTRRDDDCGLLHTRQEVDDEDHAVAKAAALLAGDPHIVYVEAFLFFRDDSYTTWFRLGRDTASVAGPGRAPAVPIKEGVN